MLENKRYKKPFMQIKYKESTDKEIDQCRRANGLPPLRRHNIECLKCSNEFMSFDVKNNKLCQNCINSNETYFDFKGR